MMTHCMIPDKENILENKYKLFNKKSLLASVQHFTIVDCRLKCLNDTPTSSSSPQAQLVMSFIVMTQ